MSTIVLRGDHVTLAQALKAAGVVGSGGQAKAVIRDGQVSVNGAVERQPGRKLRRGDRFALAGGGEWLLMESE
jgi:ribosome-associated protein